MNQKMYGHFQFMISSLIIYIGIFTAGTSIAGIKIGNGDGGDAVLCHETERSDQPRAGYYSLDYLATVGLQFGDSVEIASWTESAARIAAILDAVSPEMGRSFSEYVKDVRNTTDYTRAHVWEIAPFGLVSINDQQIVTIVPENCLEHGALKAVQAVVHQNDEISGRPVGKQIYNFVPQVLDELERTSPLQLSFLYVHEWLWKHSDNVSRNRRINRFLHGRAVENMSPDAIRSQLIGMGLNMESRPGPLPVPNAPESKKNAYAHPESDEYISSLFDAKNYCSSHRRVGADRTVIGHDQKFRFYSKIIHPKRNVSSFSTFGFKQTGARAAMANYILQAKIEPLFGEMFDLTLDGGEVQFSCMATTRDQPSLGSDIVVCHATRDGEPLYWPNSSKPVSFSGILDAGCFYAKSDEQSLGMDDFDGQFVIVGYF